MLCIDILISIVSFGSNPAAATNVSSSKHTQIWRLHRLRIWQRPRSRVPFWPLRTTEKRMARDMLVTFRFLTTATPVVTAHPPMATAQLHPPVATRKPRPVGPAHPHTAGAEVVHPVGETHTRPAGAARLPGSRSSTTLRIHLWGLQAYS